jgi:hypothetical protein
MSKTTAKQRERWISGARAAVAEMKATGALSADEAAGLAVAEPVKIVGNLEYQGKAVRPLAAIPIAILALAEINGNLLEIETELEGIQEYVNSPELNPIKAAARQAGAKIAKVLPFDSASEAEEWANKYLPLTAAKKTLADLFIRRESLRASQHELEGTFLEKVNFVGVGLFGLKENAALEKLAMLNEVSLAILQKI